MRVNLTNNSKKCSGLTLIEMMVAFSVGGLVLMSMGLIFVTSSRSFAAMSNYVSMDRDSRKALDQMTRDIRRSQNLTTFTTNRLVFQYAGTTNLVYNWDPASARLTQWKTGGQTNTLLTNCVFLKFAMTDNTLTPTTGVSQGKTISVAWKCSQRVVGTTVTSDDMQQALVVIRNKPVL